MELHELQSRVAELEGQIDGVKVRARWALLVAVLLSAAVGLTVLILILAGLPTWWPHHGVIRGQTLVLSSSNGRGAILLGVEEDGTAAMSFRGPNDRKQALLGTAPDGTALLTFFDGKGEQRLSVGVLGDYTLMLLGDARGRDRMVLKLEDDGSPVIRFEGTEGETSYRLPPERK